MAGNGRDAAREGPVQIAQHVASGRAGAAPRRLHPMHEPLTAAGGRQRTWRGEGGGRAGGPRCACHSRGGSGAPVAASTAGSSRAETATGGARGGGGGGSSQNGALAGGPRRGAPCRRSTAASL